MYERTGEIPVQLYQVCIDRDDVNALDALLKMNYIDVRTLKWGQSVYTTSLNCAAYCYQICEEFNVSLYFLFSADNARYIVRLAELNEQLKREGIHDLFDIRTGWNIRLQNALKGKLMLDVN